MEAVTIGVAILRLAPFRSTSNPRSGCPCHAGASKKTGCQRTQRTGDEKMRSWLSLRAFSKADPFGCIRCFWPLPVAGGGFPVARGPLLGGSGGHTLAGCPLALPWGQWTRLRTTGVRRPHFDDPLTQFRRVGLRSPRSRRAARLAGDGPAERKCFLPGNWHNFSRCLHQLAPANVNGFHRRVPARAFGKRHGSHRAYVALKVPKTSTTGAY